MSFLDSLRRHTDALPTSPTTRMLVALNVLDKHIYEGTVPRAEIERRRARNKRARAARRAHRLARGRS